MDFLISRVPVGIIKFLTSFYFLIIMTVITIIIIIIIIIITIIKMIGLKERPIHCLFYGASPLCE